MRYDADFKIERGFVQEGRTFSSEAMTALGNEMAKFVAHCIIDKWDKTGEPPTVMDIHVSVDAS